MARRINKHLRPARPLGSGHASSVDKRDGTWVVRSIAGGSSTKAYKCPGCHREIPPGTAHVVAWPHDGGWQVTSPVSERRHWHNGCWTRRS